MQLIEYEFPKLPPNWVDGIAQAYLADREAERTAYSTSRSHRDLTDLERQILRTQRALLAIPDREISQFLRRSEEKNGSLGSRENLIADLQGFQRIIEQARSYIPADRSGRDFAVLSLIESLEDALRQAGYEHMRGKLAPLLRMILQACDKQAWTPRQINDLIQRARNYEKR